MSEFAVFPRNSQIVEAAKIIRQYAYIYLTVLCSPTSHYHRSLVFNQIQDMPAAEVTAKSIGAKGSQAEERCQMATSLSSQHKRKKAEAEGGAIGAKGSQAEERCQMATSLSSQHKRKKAEAEGGGIGAKGSQQKKGANGDQSFIPAQEEEAEAEGGGHWRKGESAKKKGAKWRPVFHPSTRGRRQKQRGGPLAQRGVGRRKVPNGDQSFIPVQEEEGRGEAHWGSTWR